MTYLEFQNMKKTILFAAVAAFMATVSVAQSKVVTDDTVGAVTSTSAGVPIAVDSLSCIDAGSGWILDLSGGTAYQPAVVFFGSVDATMQVSSKLSFNEFGSISVDLAEAYIYPNIFVADALGHFPFMLLRPDPMPPQLLGLEIGVQAAWLDWTVVATDTGVPVYTVTSLKSNVISVVIQ